MPGYERQTFDRKRIEADGFRFEDCIFNECTIVYAGGDLPSFINCTFDHCAFVFEGSASNTVELLRTWLMDTSGFGQLVRQMLDVSDEPPHPGAGKFEPDDESAEQTHSG
ncbi:hypothetical protein [Marinivivus vitaminiproducens]|uniref:hypothetical protein n=1 Tax=Marinivivus vitaminiproducens TaxID=3035935 RepID=UPI0027A531E8|nr:hypothetical protein P4R82_08180 [Geminicoccaceae bacterium SCSIO 64248]